MQQQGLVQQILASLSFEGRENGEEVEVRIEETNSNEEEGANDEPLAAEHPPVHEEEENGVEVQYEAHANDENASEDNENENTLLEERTTVEYVKRDPCCSSWTYLTEGILHSFTRRVVVALATSAATNPIRWVCSVVFFSFAVAVIGLFTNFVTEFDQRAFLTPSGSLPDIHSEWIAEDSGFEKIRAFWATLHANGDNVLTAQAMRQAIETMDTIFALPDFEHVCNQSQYLDYHTNQPTCRIFTVTQFWNHNNTLLEEELKQFDTETKQDAYVLRTVSQTLFPDGTPVFHEAIMGNYNNETIDDALDTLGVVHVETTEVDGRPQIQVQGQPVLEQGWFISGAQSLVFKLDLPDLGEETDELERQLMDGLEALRQKYKRDQVVQLDYFTLNAYQQEFQRAINEDMPLVFVLVIIMLSFASFVFYRRKEKVQSRALLGAYSFLTILMSLLTGYGLMFLCAVPLTSVGTLIPFVVTGIALDDTFIITGAYFRRLRERQQQQPASDSANDKGDIVSIIQEVMNEVGVSISMTTTTTLVCFLLGTASSIPAVRWLCLYAATVIAADFFYQCTFFVSLLTLDERRVRANRKDICLWIVVKDDEEEDQDEANEPRSHESKNEINEDENRETVDSPSQPKEKGQLDQNFMERFMKWYADRLLKPKVKLFVIVAFLAYFAGCTYSTTLLYQEFNIADYVPRDSMLTSFMVAFQQFTSIQRFIGVYFRNVDQSDPLIQELMSRYVEDMANLPQIGEPPNFFWVRDFEQLASSEQAAESGIDLDSLSFNDQIDIALSIPPVRQIYAQDIVRDEVSGEITASRTFLYLRHVDMKDIKNQTAMYTALEDTMLAQRVNAPELQKNGELSFFSFDDLYFFWELYSVIVDELIFTTISCVVVVSVIALLYIPHWSAMAFVTPLIIMLYFMLLGTMQYCGIKIHSITYFIVVMAIGLLVDFVMHFLLRYYETKGTTRDAKVKEALETMGVSILLGGFTTWLGVIPLAFSTTKTFMTVFISFLAMVTLGCSVGLAFLPVLLSLVGPVDTVAASKATGNTPPSESTVSVQSQTGQVGIPGVRDGEEIERADTFKFTLTPEEKEEVSALQKVCEEDNVEYRSIFELATYCLTVRSLVQDDVGNAAQKRTKLALERLMKRRQWEAQHGIEKIDSMQAVKEIDEAARDFFAVRNAGYEDSTGKANL